MKFVHLFILIILTTIISACDPGVNQRNVALYCGTLNEDKIFCVDSFIYLALVRFENELALTIKQKDLIIKQIGAKKFQELSPLYEKIILEMGERIEYFEDQRPNIVIRFVFFDTDLSWLGYKFPKDEYKEKIGMLINQFNVSYNLIANSSESTPASISDQDKNTITEEDKQKYIAEYVKTHQSNEPQSSVGNELDSNSGSTSNGEPAEASSTSEKNTQIEAVTPSFNCDKASNNVEIMICENPELSILDNKLSQAYAKCASVASDKQALKTAQLSWMKSNRNICSSVNCIAEAYLNRLDEIEASFNENTSNHNY